MTKSAYNIIEKALKGKTFRYRPTNDLYKFSSLDRNNTDDIWVENLSQNKPERFLLGQLMDLFELSKSELEQLAQSSLPFNGRGQEPVHQRGSQPFIVPGPQVGDKGYHDDYEPGNLA